MDWMFVRLDEVGFPHPTFCCRAVCHAEGAVSGNEAAKYYVDPGDDHRCEEFKQIIRRAKQQVVGDCESPRKALIAVAVEACGAGVVSDKPLSAFNLSSATIFFRVRVVRSHRLDGLRPRLQGGWLLPTN